MLTDNSYGKFKYILYQPDGGGFPLIVVLHGSGEIWSDLGKLKKREPYISLNNGKCKPDAVILMPQLPKGTWGEYKAALKELIDHVADEQGCDVKRVSLTGHSLGANGTLDMLLAYPDYFSAASVLSPCKDIGDKMKQIAHVPMWFLAGAKENNYRKYAVSMHDRLKNLGGETKLTLVPGYGHPIQFTWVSDKYDMFDWLASFENQMMEVGGMICDVAKYQGLIDWAKLAPALDFVIIKASGKTKDPYFDRNAAQAVAHGVPWHAYHFLYCTTEARAKQEAKLFSDSVGKFSPLVWVLDCEAAWGVADRKARTIAEAFEAELRRLRGNDIFVALYVAHQKYKDWMLDYQHYYYVWIPRYRKVDVGLPNGTRPDYPCDIWQYTSNGTLPGISGRVDLDMIVSDKPMEYFTHPKRTTDKPKESDTMATVKIGSARIDENGNATGGKAGDQTGKEVSTQNWYKHNKGWRVFRAKDPSVAEKIAWDMQAACDNPKIGYDQSQRDTLYTVAKLVGFDCAKVAAACETDCSALVRVCCAYAGVMLPNIRTTNEPKALLDSGAFVELTGAKYTDSPDYLRRGDILCTKTQGHTVVVLSSGSKAEVAPVAQGLSRGDHGSAVTAMQEALLKWDPKCLPKWGADGDFGSETEAALKAFQASAGLPVTGIYDDATRAKLTGLELEPEPIPDGPEGPEWILATGNVNVRSAPGTDARVIGVMHKGNTAPYQGEKREWGGRDWYLIEFDGENGWVSSKYAEVTVG